MLAPWQGARIIYAVPLKMLKDDNLVLTYSDSPQMPIDPIS